MQFDRGYLSPHFITNPDSMEVEFKDPYIFIYEDKVSSVKGLVPLLEKIAKTGKPLLVVAEDVEGEALATLVVNKLRGTISCAAIKAPGMAIAERQCSMILPFLRMVRRYLKTSEFSWKALISATWEGQRR